MTIRKVSVYENNALHSMCYRTYYTSGKVVTYIHKVPNTVLDYVDKNITREQRQTLKMYKSVTVEA